MPQGSAERDGQVRESSTGAAHRELAGRAGKVGRLAAWVWAGASVLALVGMAAFSMGAGKLRAPGDYTLIAYNDLGMHCMQNDFSQMMVLPPFNTVRAQLIRRGVEPEILTSAVVSFTIPGNTHSADKTNFWSYVGPLMGLSPAPDVGILGTAMSGQMLLNATRRDFAAEGIPITPIDDDGKENPYPLALLTARVGNTIVAQTQTVVPVSWEMSCNLCHSTPGESVATNILKAHDRLHGTSLIGQQPVMCASCHADNALGTPGTPGVKNLSQAMHGAHAPRMSAINLANDCYACHPGVRTTCQRDVHTDRGMDCNSCHTSMQAVANPARRPWIDVPRCADCHTKRGYEFEPAGVRFRDATGHGGVACITCHGSPHAMGPATKQTDNAQAIRLQGHAGPINTCTVCHTTPPGAWFHRSND